MIIYCSVHHAGGDTWVEADKAVQSKVFPGARFASCHECLEKGLEPRPLVVLAAIYNDNEDCKKARKQGLYLGQDITAAEIML